MSIITEALKKAEKERDKVINSKEYLNKILGPKIDMSSYKKEVPDKQPLTFTAYENVKHASSMDWRPSRTLVVSSALIIGTIIFLSAMNVFVITSTDVKTATSEGTVRPAGNFIEAETYTTAMQPDINLIERKPTILDKMSRALKGGAITDEFMSNFTLNGIMYDTDNSWAIINNRMVRTGDVLDGAKIISISPQKVILTFKRETFGLTVK
ncbi:MAG: general secretion pathway protein GspB [Candidatus Omnitrophica bacterium]|nr:general secretion pathway protein GspB [Candidatus Omnitrophota bacterium]